MKKYVVSRKYKQGSKRKGGRNGEFDDRMKKEGRVEKELLKQV